MPAVPRGNSNPPTIAIAERAAHLIRGNTPLAPAHPQAELAAGPSQQPSRRTISDIREPSSDSPARSAPDVVELAPLEAATSRVSDSVSLADSDRMPRASAGTKPRTTRPLLRISFWPRTSQRNTC
jgi:hypothetical protein